MTASWLPADLAPGACPRASCALKLPVAATEEGPAAAAVTRPSRGEVRAKWLLQRGEGSTPRLVTGTRHFSSRDTAPALCSCRSPRAGRRLGGCLSARPLPARGTGSLSPFNNAEPCLFVPGAVAAVQPGAGRRFTPSWALWDTLPFITRFSCRKLMNNSVRLCSCAAQDGLPAARWPAWAVVCSPASEMKTFFKEHSA